MRITITNTLGEVVEQLESAITRCTDFAPLWADLRGPWEHSRRVMYETLGASTGAPWPTYDETGERDWYVWWKAAVLERTIQRPSDLNDLILRWSPTERLYPSLTNTRHPWAIWRPRPLDLTMGTRVWYASRHDEGQGRAPAKLGGEPVPKRPLLRFGLAFVRDTGKALGDHAARVTRELGDGARVRSGFTTAQVLARLSGRTP